MKSEFKSLKEFEMFISWVRFHRLVCLVDIDLKKKKKKMN